MKDADGLNYILMWRKLIKSIRDVICDIHTSWQYADSIDEPEYIYMRKCRFYSEMRQRRRSISRKMAEIETEFEELKQLLYEHTN